jgi:hypothetical protein
VIELRDIPCVESMIYEGYFVVVFAFTGFLKVYLPLKFLVNFIDENLAQKILTERHLTEKSVGRAPCH